MVGKKAFKSKLLMYVCVFVIGIVAMPVTAYAVDIGGVEFVSNEQMASKTYYYTDTKADGVQISDNRYEFTKYVEGIFYFTFYASDYIFKYESVNLNYDFTLTESYSYGSFENLTTDFTMIVAGKEYAMVSTGGWINVNTVDPNATTYITIKCKYSGDYTYSTYYTDSQSVLDVSVPVRFTLTMNAFNQYNNEGADAISIMDSKIDALLEGNEGVEGAIRDQTGTIVSESQKEQALQSEANELQEEANTLQEEANETSKNIFEKITDFFDNFFTRLGDFLLGLIVPSSVDLTAFLNEVNDWFSERLGFIWYPFSFAVDAVNALAGGEADTGITVPALTLNMFGGSYTIWNEMHVDLDAFGIFKYVRVFTSFLCVGGIVALAYNKWDEWIGGHGVG